MMATLAVVPVALGYLVATRVLRERQWLLRLLLAYALGLTFFLFGVNVGVHALSLRASVVVTVGVMALVALGLARLRAPGRAPTGLTRLEGPGLVVLATTIGFWTLFWQMKHVDQDFYLHGPLLAAFARDVFPPRNPLFPDVALLGHYGRDLAVAAGGVFFGDRVFAVQYVVTALNQSAIAVLAYLLTRRWTRSGPAAILTVLLAFFGVNAALRHGLLDTFGNNNSFVYLLLFLNVYLYSEALTHRSWPVVAVAALGMATYALVYETHYGILLLVFALFPVTRWAIERRGRRRHVAVTALIALVSLAIALVQGGTLSELARRRLLPASVAPASTDKHVALAAQEASLRFPKPGFRITSYDGTEYSLLSPRVVREAGPFAAVLPVAIALLLATRCWWGLSLASMAVLALLVPASLDFGSYNADSFRFLFLAGLGAAMASGVAAGLALDRVVRGRRLWWASAAVAIVLVAACAPSLRSVLVPQFADAWRHPDRYFWRTEEWACNGVTRAVCDPLDAAAALTLRTLTGKDDRILTNVGRKEFLVHPIVSALAGAPVTGHGLRLSSSRTVTMGTGYREPQGFQAIAFWHTGDASLLARMSVTWLLLDPTRMEASAYRHLLEQGALQLVDRREDPRRGERREVYRVTPLVRSGVASALPQLVLTSVELPSPLWPARFYTIPFTVTPVGDDRVDGVLDVGGRMVRDGVVINANDEVRRLVRLESSKPRQWRGTLWMVTPYETGEYELAPDVTDGRTRIPLVGPDGVPWRLRLQVSSPTAPAS